MKHELNSIAMNAVRILDLCQEIASGEYSEKGIQKRLKIIRENALSALDTAESLLKDMKEDAE